MNLFANKKVVVFSSDCETSACAYIRLISPLKYQGVEFNWVSERMLGTFRYEAKILDNVDLVIVQRHIPSAFTAKLFRKVIKSGVPIVYDLDDSFLEIPKTHPHYDGYRRRRPYIKWLLNEVDLITVSTQSLKDDLSKFTKKPILVNQNIVDWSVFFSGERNLTNKINFLVSGTATHQHDWTLLEQPLQDILNAYPERVSVTFFGEVPGVFSGHTSVRFIPFEREYVYYASGLQKLDASVALVPLQNNKFNQSKSNIKWLEYSAAGIVGIFSNITPYNSFIEDGRTGYLVNNSSEAWFQAMEHVIQNPDESVDIIKRAQDEVWQGFSIEKMSAEYVGNIFVAASNKAKNALIDDLMLLPYRFWSLFFEFIYKSDFMNRYVLWRFNVNKN